MLFHYWAMWTFLEWVLALSVSNPHLKSQHFSFFGKKKREEREKEIQRKGERDKQGGQGEEERPNARKRKKNKIYKSVEHKTVSKGK